MKRRERVRKAKRRKRERARASSVKRSARSAKGTRKPVLASAQEETGRELRRLRAARAQLERRLTAAVQEIGTLRQFEVRASMLDAQLQRREQELARLRHESEERIRELESRLGGATMAAPPP